MKTVKLLFFSVVFTLTFCFAAFASEKKIPATENFTNDVKYVGDWSDEPLKPFFRIEWIKVKPRYLKYQGRLVKDIVIDCSSEFLEILKKKSIPYEEKNGNYIIFGYK